MAYAFVQKVNNAANAPTLAIAPSAGNLLLVCSQTSTGAGPIASLTDNLSSTYSTALATISPAGSSYNYTFFYLKNVPTGITGITESFSGGSTPGNCSISALEYSGLDPTSPFIGITAGNVQVAPGTTANLITSLTLSLSVVPCALIALCNDEAGNAATAGTGFTSRGAGFNSAGEGLYEDQRFTVNTTPAATYTSATHGATDTFTTFALAFAEPIIVPTAPFTPFRKTQFFVTDTVIQT